MKAVPALMCAAALAGCGVGGDNPTVAASPVSTPSKDLGKGSDLVACVTQPPTVPAAPGSTKDLALKPIITLPKSPAPCDLQVSDIVVGTGPAAKTRDAMTVKYVGVLYQDGKEFDSSWARGTSETFPFRLGSGGVIAGWDQGLLGMKAGGRRQLTIPPALAYGEQGQGGIPAGATLVFVVDLVKISP